MEVVEALGVLGQWVVFIGGWLIGAGMWMMCVWTSSRSLGRL